ncbi:hypothetical protein ALC56_03946 [Trachymyrmex septentrionalis]|uniref:Uncharacterized protein n=1 Tax=Trachymyrmex septentrionalis TaxID=34720 RepID=A0A151JZA4_9HYME|nr:hypothetical protein ALC56_03946 [Trachymyrmex septentrionalis]
MKESKAQPCLFCGEKHDSSSCEKAKGMDMDERSKIVKEKNGCFRCLKVGQSYKKFYSKEKCPWCSKGHCLLMCRNLSSNSQKSVDEKPNGSKFNEGNSCLANVSSAKIFLPILKIRMRGPRKSVSVRAIIDTGSHRSYILKRLARDLGYEAEGEQTMVHLLFGGTKTKPQKHKSYRIHIGNLEGTYKCDFIALQQDTICQDVPNIGTGLWTEALKEKNVHLSDTGETRESISLLIGADVVGKLFTGKIIQLNQGATAIETKLGWTILGRNSEEKARQEEIKALLQETTKITEKGHFDVILPWKDNHPPLQDNRDMAKRRLDVVTKKLKQENLFDDYNTIFSNWLEEGIIEKVPVHEVDRESYYLPPVVKRGGTTRIRPVFDASAKKKDTPSLNQCLETGSNLIELVPALLHRFREKRIGVTIDIAKAFLQISVSPSDRDVLRFLWWHTNGEIETYRRVVFGITSSPFLLGATKITH